MNMRHVSFEEISIREPYLPRTADRMWAESGLTIAPFKMPDRLINRYRSVRDKITDPGGWNMPTPYLYYDEIKDISLYKPLMEFMKNLVGDDMLLHLNLTPYTSTSRAAHKDEYLNPPNVGDQYCAAWIALEDIHPHSGPFEYVAGSHLWPRLCQEKVFKIMKEEQGIEPSDPLWPTKTQDWVAAACEEETQRRGESWKTYTPFMGQVMVWHSSLIHRGSVPKNPVVPRRALICHYSGVNSRPDMGKRGFHKSLTYNSEGEYFDSGLPLDGPQRV